MPFKIIRNDITRMQVDIIVNTANEQPAYSAGTDAAVYLAAGVERLSALHRNGQYVISATRKEPR